MKKLTDARPQTRNANKHTPRGLGALEGSIQQDGWIGAITVAADGETFDGSARIEVGARAGFDDAIVVESDGSKPVIVKRTDIPNADDPRAVRLGVAANRIAQMDLAWDAGVLAELAQEHDLSALFTSDELAALLEDVQVEPGGGGDEFDATPEDGPTRTQVGELWVIGGKHRLLVGDCTDPANVARLMGGERAQAIITDPPYGIELDSATSRLQREKGNWQSKPKEYAPIIGDDNPFDRRVVPVEAEEEFWWGADYYIDTLSNNGKDGSWLVWDKRMEGALDSMLGSMFELCWSKQRHRRDIIRATWIGLYGTESQDIRERVHPAQKALQVIEWIMERYTSNNDLTFDGYLGSGTTIIAAHRTGRRCYGMEISPRYADVILRRAEAEGLECDRIDG